MGLAPFRVVLTLVAAGFLVRIIGADDFANPGGSLVRNGSRAVPDDLRGSGPTGGHGFGLIFPK